MNRQALRQRVADMQTDTPDGSADSIQPALAGNTKENIFLFVPNPIGMLVKLLR
jgi:hypothetical protein